MKANFAQSVSMPCPSKEDYERDLQQSLLDLGYSELITNFREGHDVLTTRYTSDPHHTGVTCLAHISRAHHLIPTYNPQLFLAISAMRVGEEIHVGEYFMCFRDVYMNDGPNIAYKSGQIYKSEHEESITDIKGNKKHLWTDKELFKKTFRKATLQELIDKFGEKEFVLPDKWRVHVTNENIEILSKWRGKVTAPHGWIKEDEWHVHNDTYEYDDNRTIITTKQFLDHVYTPWLKSQQPVPFVPKRGDVVYAEYDDSSCVFIFSERLDEFDKSLFSVHIDGYQAHDTRGRSKYTKRLATDSEKQPLFDALLKQGKRYNEKEFCIEDIPVNPHQSMIDEWEESGKKKRVQYFNGNNEWIDTEYNRPSWNADDIYRFKPEEPKESVPARPLRVKAPEGCESYLTPNKVYKVVGHTGGFNEHGGWGIKVISDNGDTVYSSEKKCLHLNGADWLVLQREGEPEPKDLTTITVGDETMVVDNSNFWIKDTQSVGIRATPIEQDIPAFAKILANSLVDETTDFKEAFRLLELVKAEVEQIHQETIATKTKERDKLTAEIKKLKSQIINNK